VKPSAKVQLRRARTADLPRLLPFVRAFYAHFGYPFGAAQRRSLRRVVGDEAIGAVWFIRADGCDVGYVALIWGWSIEYGGLVGMVDELYVDAEHRGRGIGRATLRAVDGIARRHGVRRLFLEVERANRVAKRAYLRSGYLDTGRTMMTRPLKA